MLALNAWMWLSSQTLHGVLQLWRPSRQGPRENGTKGDQSLSSSWHLHRRGKHDAKLGRGMLRVHCHDSNGLNVHLQSLGDIGTYNMYIQQKAINASQKKSV